MNSKFLMITALALASLGGTAMAQKVQYLEAKPLVDVVSTRLRPVSNLTYAPVITWGGDVHVELARLEGVFKKNGLGDLKLIREDNFQAQVQACINGETPFIRGTIGMVNPAAEALKQAGTELVVIYQLTYSTGGDTMTTRGNVGQITDLRGKTVALQLYGPHMDYAAKLLVDAGASPSEVNFKWLAELYPQEDSNPNQIDNAPMAFVEDSSIDAVMAIIPDALGLAEGDEASLLPQVDGAKILTSTKTNSKVIADVYAVRKDWADANPEKVEAFVKSLFEAEELLRDLQKQPKDARYQRLLTSSAKLLLDAEEATDVVEALLADCEHVGYAGNVGFLTGTLPSGNSTTRNMSSMSDEIQSSFVLMKIMKQRMLLPKTQLNFANLANGLRYAGQAAKSTRFDADAAQRLVEGEIGNWDDLGSSLFTREITFAPNQASFSESEYAEKYQELLELSQTNGGALIVVEGHADPLGVLSSVWKGESVSSINAKRAHVRNLSLERARQVRIAFLNYCSSHNYEVNESQFVAVGRGVEAPKHEMPAQKGAFLRWRKSDPQEAKKQWNENRRVVFRVQQVEAELDDIMSIQ